MTPRVKLGLVAAFVVLAVLAITGWLRNPEPRPEASQAGQVSGYPYQPAVQTTQPPTSQPYDQYGQPANPVQDANAVNNVAPANAPNAAPYSAGTTQGWQSEANNGQTPETVPEFVTKRYVRTMHTAPPVRQRYQEADRYMERPAPEVRRR